MGGEQRHLAYSLLFSQVINLILSVILIKPLGIVGVGMATFCSTLPVEVILIQRKACRMHDCSLWDFYKKTVMPALPSTLITMVFLYNIQMCWNIDTLVDVAAGEIIAVGLFGLSYWGIGFNSKERRFIKDKGLKRIGR